MAVAMMPSGAMHPYHRHEQVVQAMAGVDLASGEESGTKSPYDLSYRSYTVSKAFCAEESSTSVG